MSGSKAFDKIAWSVTALALVITLLFMNGSALGLAAMPRIVGYENRLFDNTRVHTIDIVMDNWDEFIRDAASEVYYMANMVIDGEAYKNVAIRGKGNTSLANVAALNSQRYSFKVEFDHYDNSMTYHGLDKLSLNNMIHDSTMMKDYLTYTLMAEFGAATPLCSFVYITVNGEEWGLYLAVEGVEDSFMLRNYNTDQGELYKPDGMGFGGGNNDDNGSGGGQDAPVGNGDNGSSGGGEMEASPSLPAEGGFESSEGGEIQPSAPTGKQTPPENNGEGSSGGGEMEASPSLPAEGGFESSEGGETQPSAPTGKQTPPENSGDGSSGGGEGGNPGGGFGGGSAVNLQYIDDNISSYSTIWNNAKTDITEEDQRRLIASLKQLSTYEDLETVLDIEGVLRYFVVHNFVCNGDSYTGSMIHNYYLYEEDGRMSMIPWDYNLAFGTFQPGSAQSSVNAPIDRTLSGSTGTDRPMWYWILSADAYTEQYHQYYREFLDTVDISGIIDIAYNLIKAYVAKDPTAFYTYEEFETGVETLRSFCTLRSVSISLQLENGETTTEMNYVDASDMVTTLMGAFETGGDAGGSSGGGEETAPTQPIEGDSPSANGGETTPSMPAEGGSEGSEGGETTPSPPAEGGSEGSEGGETAPSQPAEGGSGGGKNQDPANSQGPGGNFNPGSNTPASVTNDNSQLILISLVVLCAGLLIAKLYRC